MIESQIILAFLWSKDSPTLTPNAKVLQYNVDSITQSVTIDIH